MKDLENVNSLAHLRVDLMGLIFYAKSPRFVEKDGPAESLTKPIQGITQYLEIPKVGVFVNAEIKELLEKVRKYQLEYVQLHGQENVFYCQKLHREGLKIIKAFSVDAEFNFTSTQAFEHLCHYFLFDTKGLAPGGNGLVFDWSLLQNYKGETPFLLSGGIGPESVEALSNFQHPQWAGIDLNSRFETEPGLKDIGQLKNFLQELKDKKVLETKLPNWD